MIGNINPKVTNTILILLLLLLELICVIRYYNIEIRTGRNKLFALEIKGDTINTEYNKLSFNNRNFNGINLENCVLQCMTFENCSLKNSILTRTDFSNSTFNISVDFANAEIELINICNCSLQNVTGLKLDDLIKIPEENRERVDFPNYILDTIKICTANNNFKYCKLLFFEEDSIYCGCKD